MACLLQSVIPIDKRSMPTNAPLKIFRAEVTGTLYGRLIYDVFEFSFLYLFLNRTLIF